MIDSHERAHYGWWDCYDQNDRPQEESNWAIENTIAQIEGLIIDTDLSPVQ
jgi:hypothetical protein